MSVKGVRGALITPLWLSEWDGTCHSAQQPQNKQQHHPCQATLSHERVVTFTEQERVGQSSPFPVPLFLSPISLILSCSVTFWTHA